MNTIKNRLPLCVAIALLIPTSASAVEIGPVGTITGTTPELRWHNSSPSAVDDIEMELLSTAWTMDQNGGIDPFLEIDSTAPSDSLVIDSNGDMGIGLSSTGDTQPRGGIDLHVGGGQVLLDNLSAEWRLNPGGTGLFFLQEDNRFPFRINNNQPFSDVLALNNGRVGVGTGSPDKRFHVRGTDTSPGGGNSVAGKIENTTATTATRTMFELVNNGDPRMRYVNTASGQKWALNPLNGRFRITLDGSGVSEMDVYPGGNVTIAGTLTESSDRALKQGIEALDAGVVLEKISSMSISEWSYKASPEDRHIGPMAQDFHAAFGLGEDEKHISPRDLASVSLVAIQAQQGLIEQQAMAIEALTQRLKEVQESISGYGLGSTR